MLAKLFATAASGTVAAVMTACAAHAGPPNFPNLGGYTQVNVADYTIELPNTGGPSISVVYFLAPNNIPCTIAAGAAGCTSTKLPGAASTSSSAYTYLGTDSGIQPQGSSQFDNNTVHGTPLKPIPPMHSITFQGVTCGVDDAGMTACKDAQGEGFILSPSWSGWLAHVG